MWTKTKIGTELKKIVGDKSVLLSREELYVYSQDGTNMPKNECLADFIVFVKEISEVQHVVKFAYENNIAITCRGAGTNLIGSCIPTNGGIVLDFCKMNKILEINSKNMTIRVQPGVIVGKLQEEVEKVGLFYPPDPSNLKVSTIGGSIAQSSGGPRGFKYGTTKDYVLELTVVTSDGRIMRTGSNTVKNATGYNLSQLFVGSEGTLGIVVEALLKLIPKPEVECVIMAYFDDMEDATIAVDEIIKSRIFPSTIDFMDKNSIQTVEKFYPSGLLIDKEAVLIIEIQTMLASLYYEREKISEILEKNKAVNIQISKTKTESEKIWTARRSSFGAAAKLAVNVETDDIIVPRENLVKLVKGIRQICEKYSLLACVVGHVGDGNVHPQVALDLKNETEYNHYVSAKKEIIDLTLSLNGTLSGEHGIGLLKKEFLPKFLDDVELEYMKKIKKLFDEKNILNPGKIFDL